MNTNTIKNKTKIQVFFNKGNYLIIYLNHKRKVHKIMNKAKVIKLVYMRIKNISIKANKIKS